MKESRTTKLEKRVDNIEECIRRWARTVADEYDDPQIYDYITASLPPAEGPEEEA